MPRWNGKISDDIFAHAIPEPNSGCWLWERGRQSKKDDYPRVFYKGRSDRAHRIAFEVANKCSILPGFYVCHACDMPPCINPDHLFLSDHDGNMRDKGLKGRAKVPKPKLRGTGNGNCRLSERDVLVIRSDTRKLLEIANDYGLSFQHVSDIRLRKKWKYL